MQDGLKKGLALLNRADGLEIGIGTREIYNDVIKIATFFYAFYGGLILYLGNVEASLVIFSVTAVNVLLLLFKKIPYFFLVNIEHTVLMILVFYAVIRLGWQYGFQIILIIGITLSFFAPYKRRILVFIFPILEMSSYILLLLLYGKDSPSFVSPEPWPTIIHVGLIIDVSFLSVYSTQKADIFSLMNSRRMATVAENLTTIANQDELTGLYNRRSIQDVLAEKWDAYNSIGEEFYIVMADVDCFKELNDSYGHNAGDFVLQKAATLLRDEFRRSDFVSRWGGDEFLIVVPGAGSFEEIRELLERVRLRAENTSFHISSTEDVRITMTFGCASCQGKATIQSMIASADEQLYIGKKSGRNIVVTESAD